MDVSTLETLRRASGKSLGRILSDLRLLAPEIAPQQRSGIINWEKQGITDVRVIRGLATVYQQPFEVVEQAALESRRRFLERKLPKSAITA